MQKPEVGPIEGAAPAELVIEDITVGDGPEAKAGQVVYGALRRVSHSPARSSTPPGTAASRSTSPLGGGQVIAGWDQGVAGMRVGGRRKLTIPPHLGYGSRGAGGAIKPNETLVFVVDLVGVR